MKKLFYCASCKKDKEWKDIIASDATELAQIVENGEELYRNEFYSIANVDKKIVDKIASSFVKDEKRYRFFVNFGKNIAWIYDCFKDIHYFYKEI